MRPLAGLGGVLAAIVALASSEPCLAAPKAPEGMRVVGPGIYRPLYAASPAERAVPVQAFFLDARPVTNADYLAFVESHPEWRRDQVARLFADESYLSHWQGPEELGSKVRAKSPVTWVSWFAAKAYCAARSVRLPSEREWELAALASEKSADGSRDPRWMSKILGFYSKPAVGLLPEVGTSKPNVWGIHDLHGLAWEWIYDFGASLVAADSREKGEGSKLRFCGASGANAQNPTDYANFMRVALRSSLEAPYTTARLGFRCAKDLKEKP
jgi:formylglycine-generating enzyme required for sulfatase activity